MGTVYFKRFRMELDLAEPLNLGCHLPAGYTLLPWSADLLSEHAQAKYFSFRMEIDANVFPCLGSHEGCLNLMQENSRKDCFVPEATWLVHFEDPTANGHEFCGTIQGIRDRSQCGAIQNLGIIPGHRDRNIGTCLLQQSLNGFQQLGMQRAVLEVTARNRRAISLYERLGFRTVRTVYKSVEMSCV